MRFLTIQLTASRGDPRLLMFGMARFTFWDLQICQRGCRKVSNDGSRSHVC
jgi:hypothetical protein